MASLVTSRINSTQCLYIDETVEVTATRAGSGKRLALLHASPSIAVAMVLFWMLVIVCEAVEVNYSTAKWAGLVELGETHAKSKEFLDLCTDGMGHNGRVSESHSIWIECIALSLCFLSLCVSRSFVIRVLNSCASRLHPTPF